MRIAVVVNDMSSVNVDAELVRQGGGLVQQEEKMIELSNGCICCTLREDLLTSLSSLAAETRFDHVRVLPPTCPPLALASAPSQAFPRLGSLASTLACPTPCVWRSLRHTHPHAGPRRVFGHLGAAPLDADCRPVESLLAVERTRIRVWSQLRPRATTSMPPYYTIRCGASSRMASAISRVRSTSCSRDAPIVHCTRLGPHILTCQHA